MNAKFESVLPVSGPFRGVAQILRFNWPWYAGTVLVLAGGGIALGRAELSLGLKGIGALIMAVTLFWGVASLLASYWIYDRSALTRWAWLADLPAFKPVMGANIHAGFDETTTHLRRVFPACRLDVWDIYQPAVMSENSIRRARQIRPAGRESVPVDFARLPAVDNALDVVFAIFAAHEVRSPGARERMFHGLMRILKSGGSILVVEHLRDWKNFLAYGPGFLHFLPEREWLRLAKLTGLHVEANFGITPFVKVFRFTKPGAL